MKPTILLAATLSLGTGIFLPQIVRADAPPATQPSDDVTALIRQLGDDDFHVRQSASQKLKELGKAALPALKDARKSTDPEVRAQVDELLGDIDHPAAEPLPQATGGGNMSVRVSVTNGDKTVDVDEPGRTVHIEENGAGINMQVSGHIDGKAVTRKIKAKTPEQLKKENPDAFALYKQYASGNDVVQMQFQANVIGGAIINRQFAVNPPVQQPIPKPNFTGDNLDKLEGQLEEQMKAAKIPDDKQEHVKQLLKDLKDSLPKAGADNDADERMRTYNDKSDALRQALMDLKLPDPGEALPPPSWGRLGISAMEETVPDEGLRVTHVLANSRAERIGLKEQDIIQKVDGHDIHATSDLRKLVTANPKSLVIDILRDGKPMKLTEPPKAPAKDDKK